MGGGHEAAASSCGRRRQQRLCPGCPQPGAAGDAGAPGRQAGRERSGARQVRGTRGVGPASAPEDALPGRQEAGAVEQVPPFRVCLWDRLRGSSRADLGLVSQGQEKAKIAVEKCCFWPQVVRSGAVPGLPVWLFFLVFFPQLNIDQSQMLRRWREPFTGTALSLG